MGTRGPAPKRSAERRRRNKQPDPDTVQVEGEVEQPGADERWHPVAKRWFDSLEKSGQSEFYQPSDWAMAYLIAESISRDLKPQVVGITEDGEVKKATIPLKGASLAAYLKAMSSLLVSEADRRRAGIELERESNVPEKPKGVTALADYRATLAG